LTFHFISNQELCLWHPVTHPSFHLLWKFRHFFNWEEISREMELCYACRLLLDFGKGCPYHGIQATDQKKSDFVCVKWWTYMKKSVRMFNLRCKYCCFELGNENSASNFRNYYDWAYMQRTVPTSFSLKEGNCVVTVVRCSIGIRVPH